MGRVMPGQRRVAWSARFFRCPADASVVTNAGWLFRKAQGERFRRRGFFSRPTLLMNLRRYVAGACRVQLLIRTAGPELPPAEASSPRYELAEGCLQAMDSAESADVRKRFGNRGSGGDHPAPFRYRRLRSVPGGKPGASGFSLLGTGVCRHSSSDPFAHDGPWEEPRVLME